MTGRAGILVFLFLFLAALFFLTATAYLTKIRKTTANFQLGELQNTELKRLENMKIFFAHQSVGENIISGLEYVFEDFPELRLEIVESKDISSVGNGSILHTKIGRNTRPVSKIRAFAKVLDSAPPGTIDIALLKFCYVDLNSGADPQALFDTYRARIAVLQENHPETVFIHTTVPIESAPLGAKKVVKGWAKAALRRPGVLGDNRVRGIYNDLIRETYRGVEPVFDIAMIESVGPKGRRNFRPSGSGPVFFMDRSYTTDGGHLNRLGQIHLAEQFLVALGDAAQRVRDE